MTLYQEIRAAGKEMHAKALRATRDLDFDGIRIAKRLTVPVLGRNILLESEVVQYAYFDFWMNEYRVAGKSMAQSVDPVKAEMTPLESELLQAHCCAQASLFNTGTVRPEQHQVELTDLLHPEREKVWLTDLSLSESFHRLGFRRAIYCRPVTVRGITLTSGFSLSFKIERVPGLLQAYRQKMKKVPAADLPEQQFIFFFQKNRQVGEDQLFQDVD